MLKYFLSHENGLVDRAEDVEIFAVSCFSNAREVIGFSCAPVQAGGAGACWKLVIWLPCQFVGEVAALLKRLEALFAAVLICSAQDASAGLMVCF